MKLIDRLANLFANIAGYGMMAVMFFIVIGVVARYVFGAPIFGSQDVLEMMLIGVTMFGMAYCARTGGHVAVDLFEGMLGRVGCLIGDVIARLLGISMLLLLVWGASEKMLDAYEWGDATNLLRIPFWPLYGLIVLSALLYAAVLIEELLRMPFAAKKTESGQ